MQVGITHQDSLIRKQIMIKKISRIVSIASFVTFLTFNLSAGTSLFDTSDEGLGGWKGFGTGYADGNADAVSKEIQIDVIWSNASWGVGLMYVLNGPIDGSKLQSIRLDVRTVEGSNTRVFAGIATKGEANLTQNARLAEKVNDQWRTVEFPISEMRIDRPEKNSPVFGPSDWKKIQIVKILFKKPKEVTANEEIIRVRNPELIFAE